MQRTLISPNISSFPDEIKPLIAQANVYDSSCSPEAKVYFIDRDTGYYLKVSESGSLMSEARLDEYFNSLGLGPRVLSYITQDSADWLLTERVAGEDATHREYLSEPRRLAEFLGHRLRLLHEVDFKDCPQKDRLSEYLATAEKNSEKGIFNPTFSDISKLTKKEAQRLFLIGKEALCKDTLIHGDYCLPNIILDGWKLSGFVDLGFAGVADRHIDIFWGAWTLNFNLGTDEYRNDFFRAYGKDRIDTDLVRLVGIIECFA